MRAVPRQEKLRRALLCERDVKAIASGWVLGSEAFRQELLAPMSAELSTTEADFRILTPGNIHFRC